MKEERSQPTQQVKTIIREYQEQLYANKMGNLEEMDKFLETYTLPKLKQEEIENLNRPITSKETELVIKNLPKNQSPGSDGFPGTFYQTFKGRVNTYSLEGVPKIEMEGKLPNSFYEANITLIPKPDRYHTKKGELQTNFPDEHGCKNPQQDISQPNATIH